MAKVNLLMFDPLSDFKINFHKSELFRPEKLKIKPDNMLNYSDVSMAVFNYVFE